VNPIIILPLNIQIKEIIVRIITKIITILAITKRLKYSMVLRMPPKRF
jgi:hypothetical protein